MLRSLTSLVLILILSGVGGSQSVRTSKKRKQRLSETVSYTAPVPSAEAKALMEKQLAEAQATHERNPKSADAVIWLGRRTAYLGRFDDAIGIYTKGLRRHHKDARIYRHRGHRYITTRRFDLAIKDLERAAKLVASRQDENEPDGQPNARNIPTSTLKSNIWYHLGLAYYLQGDFERAVRAYRECMKFSRNPDMAAATSHWLYMSLRRMKRHDEARAVLDAIADEADIIENHDYQRLLMMYKGKLSAVTLMEDAAKKPESISFSTVGYGVATWYLCNGESEKAVKTLVTLAEKSPQRTSFGLIAAEADLKRVGLGEYVDSIRNPKTLRVLN